MKILPVSICVLILFSINISAQKSREPKVIRYIPPSKIRDKKIEVAAKKFGDGDNSKAEKQANGYIYAKIDLNSDKIPEVVIYLTGSQSCGTGGCGTMILQLVKGEYKLVTFIAPSRVPIIVANQSTKGWKDLIMPIYGGGIMRMYFAVLKFNGKTYPENPTSGGEEDELVKPLRKRVSGIGIFLEKDL